MFVCFWDWQLSQEFDLYLGEDFPLLIRVRTVIPGRNSAIEDTEQIVRVIILVGDCRSVQSIRVVKVLIVVCSDYLVCRLPCENLRSLENLRLSHPQPGTN